MMESGRPPSLTKSKWDALLGDSGQWTDAEPGEHSVTSRAVDTRGNIQPTQDDQMIANKVTYWESNGQIMRMVEIPA